MKTLFRSQELWDLIEDGFTDVVETDAEEKKRLNERRMQKLCSLFNKPFMRQSSQELQQLLPHEMLG
ncbi:hypothetical protein KY289_011549 [Solanum tuberosum]|nr:hypothetical protein KY289_011549 [Solanum tuberosum]KAH0709629.1 hypothetical protein KY284_011056 [Solanum tuberosum]